MIFDCSMFQTLFSIHGHGRTKKSHVQQVIGNDDYLKTNTNAIKSIKIVLFIICNIRHKH